MDGGPPAVDRPGAFGPVRGRLAEAVKTRSRGARSELPCETDGTRRLAAVRARDAPRGSLRPLLPAALRPVWRADGSSLGSSGARVVVDGIDEPPRGCCSGWDGSRTEADVLSRAAAPAWTRSCRRGARLARRGVWPRLAGARGRPAERRRHRVAAAPGVRRARGADGRSADLAFAVLLGPPRPAGAAPPARAAGTVVVHAAAGSG